MGEEFNRWKVVDPEPDATGVLLSDRIRYYVEKYDVLVDKRTFNPENLKAASYFLTLGTEYYYDGKFLELQPGDPEKCWLEIPPNAFVVATTAEKVILPHYIAARFGVRVDYVYKGLLVGAGPQVDPGFEGFLGCPIHNLTDSPVRIKAGEPFAWIDFARTTRVGDNPKFVDEDALLRDAQLALRATGTSARTIAGFKDYDCRLYQTARLSFKNSLPAGTTVVSSVKGLEKRIDEMEAEVNKWTSVSKHIEVGAGIAVLIVAITVLLALGMNLWLPRHRTLIQLEQRVTTLEKSVERSQSQQPALPDKGSPKQTEGQESAPEKNTQ